MAHMFKAKDEIRIKANGDVYVLSASGARDLNVKGEVTLDNDGTPMKVKREHIEPLPTETKGTVIEEKSSDVAVVTESGSIKTEVFDDIKKETAKKGEPKMSKNNKKEEENVHKDCIEQVAKARKENRVFGLEEEIKALELAVRNNFPVLCVGETGLGKSYALASLAKKKNKQVVRFSFNKEVGTNELLGKWLVRETSGAPETYWLDGVLTDCIRTGKWFVADEGNVGLPEVLMTFNPLMDDAQEVCLAEKNGEMVKVHPDFRLFFSINPPDEYAGTNELNKALLSRFPIVIKFKQYAPDVEKEIIKYQSGIDDTVARIMVDVANSIRKLKEEKKIYYTCSTRDLVNWARVLGCNGHSIGESMMLSVINKCADDEVKTVMEAVNRSSSIKVNWNGGASSYRKLTDDVRRDIEALEAKRAKLLSGLKEVENQVASVKAEIAK